MENISEMLLGILQKEFSNKFISSRKINEFNELLNTGKSTYKDALEYARNVGIILSQVYRDNLNEADLPEGRISYELAEAIIRPTMHTNYELISEYSKEVQTIVNKNTGLNIKGVKAKEDIDKVNGIIQRLGSEESYEKISWILQDPIVNYSQTIVDNTVRSNAEKLFQLGLRPKIVRKAEHGCCKWCSKLAGVYEYSEVKDKGNDVFRRHSNCNCLIEYVNKDINEMQNVHTKEWNYYENEEVLEKLESIKKVKQQYKATDRKEYIKYKKVLKNSKYMPKTFEDFQEMKYNNSDEYEKIKRENRTITELKSTGWNESFIKKCINHYYDFREDDVEVAKHFLQNYSRRITEKSLEKEDILKVAKKPIDCIEISNNYNIRYKKIKGNFVRVVSNENDTELISLEMNTYDIMNKRIKEKIWKKK